MCKRKVDTGLTVMQKIVIIFGHILDVLYW